jgi:hypothetical protein
VPDRPHHTAAQYACPTALYAVYVTAGAVGQLVLFGVFTDPDDAAVRAGYLAGIVVLLPVTRCNLPSRKDWKL